MELWFSEYHTPNVKLSIKVSKQICSVKSRYQQIDIFESPEFGRFLTLDGYMMLTEKDEFIYHEMMTHVPMAVNPDIKKVLIIGGGDGGVVRELVKYSSIESIDLVEIDEQVVRLCMEHLPSVSSKLTDPRVNLIFQDGLKYIRHFEDAYDLIIVDSTDPFGPGEVLFTKEFYGSCFKALKPLGIMVNQNESPFYAEDAAAMKRAHKRVVASFPICRVYQAHIPTYPSGHWLFGFASKYYHPINDMKIREWKALDITSRYYTTNLHKGSFYLPKYVEEILRDVE